MREKYVEICRTLVEISEEEKKVTMVVTVTRTRRSHGGVSEWIRHKRFTMNFLVRRAVQFCVP